MEPLIQAGALAGVKVLVVEDDDDSREVLEQLLSSIGMDVTSAASAAEAFAAFRARTPEIIVSDIAMPVEDGLSLMRRIRALPPEEGGLTPAIAISGGTQVEEALGAGFHVHMSKPFDVVKLIDVLRDFVTAGGPTTSQSWTVVRDGDRVVMKSVGHVSAADFQAIISRVADALRDGPLTVVADLRAVTGLAPSVGSLGERAIWSLRHNVREVVVLGGPWLARAVAKASCAVLGVPCRLT